MITAKKLKKKKPKNKSLGVQLYRQETVFWEKV